jgi:hypothetical protein
VLAPEAPLALAAAATRARRDALAPNDAWRLSRGAVHDAAPFPLRSTPAHPSAAGCRARLPASTSTPRPLHPALQAAEAATRLTTTAADIAGLA